jgi:hypothetical protein
MPRAKLHPDQAARLRANAEARRKAGIVRKSFDFDDADCAALEIIRDGLGLPSDLAAVKHAVHADAKKIAKSTKTG